MARVPRTFDVFINLPFDSDHENHFIALIAGLVALGLTPKCVLEVPTHQDRLRRLVQHIASCQASIHDLSEVRLSRGGGMAVPRFNMPFELGLAVAIAAAASMNAHEWRVMESRAYRIQQSLSDLNGYEVFVHEGRIDGVMRALLDMFTHSLPRAPLSTEADLMWVYRRLRRFRTGLPGGVFRPATFRQLVVAAAGYREVRQSEIED